MIKPITKKQKGKTLLQVLWQEVLETLFYAIDIAMHVVVIAVLMCILCSLDNKKSKGLDE